MSRSNGKDISLMLSEKLKLSKRDALKVFFTVVDEIEKHLIVNGEVLLKGFGKFKIQRRKGRTYTHPLTGNKITVSDWDSVKFTPSPAILEKLKNGS